MQMCVFVCVCVCVCVHSAMFLCPFSIRNLILSLINVRGLRQAPHVAFCCDRHFFFGLLGACRIRVGKMNDARTKLLNIKQTCVIHTLYNALCMKGGIWFSECERDHLSVLEKGVLQTRGSEITSKMVNSRL